MDTGSATLNGYVITYPNTTVTYYFQWGPNATSLSSQTPARNITGTGSYAFVNPSTISGLSNGGYVYQLVAIVDGKYYYGELRGFSITNVPMVVVTDPATNVDKVPGSADLNGHINITVNTNITYYYEYGSGRWV